MLEPGKITRYSASAGSGKTYQLAGIYIDFLFKYPQNYRHILAVTFTNKAAAEMKERILTNLFQLSNGEDSPYLENLLISFNSDTEIVRQRATSILKSILHDYSQFSVGTIDSFFQKVLRAFVKESGLHSGFNLILDHSVVLSEAVDEMLSSVEDDKDLFRWLIEYSRFEISQGNHWNLKRRIMELGEELFKEEYRILLKEGKIVSDKQILRKGFGELVALEKSYSSNLSNLGYDALSIISNNDVTENDLVGKSQSILKFLVELTGGVPDKLSSSMVKAWKEDKYFTGKQASPAIYNAFGAGLKEKVNEIGEVYEKGILQYKSSRLVTANLFNLGILNDVSKKIREILNDSNKFLLSDAGDLLSQIIGNDQAPFIYEKVGTRFQNFMIDEFQDTSKIQWDNFYPLILNSLAEGESNLVVGDIKQAIYRWRNSDWRILNNLEDRFFNDSFSSKVLNSNYRSAEKIIHFNNSVFAYLPKAIEESFALEEGVIESLYSESQQNDPGKNKNGYVRITELKKFDERHQNQLVLDELPLLIEEIQDNGYKAGDIGILVRKNSEGQQVISCMMDYAATVQESKQGRYNYQIISTDSLLLNNAPVIKFLIAILTHISDNTDLLARASMIHYYSLLKGSNSTSRDDLFGEDENTRLSHSVLDDSFGSYVQTIRYLPVFDIIDRVINYFDLGEDQSAIPFLNTLQDCVLDLSTTETNDITMFLDWWENEGIKKSVASPEQDESIQLMTIHKSKGLQFKVLILPFLSWSMGHGKVPAIWVYSDIDPFKSLGAVPVIYKKEIAETYFKKYYDKEKLNITIDKLNLLYVAMTRAEDCLYGFVPVGAKRDNNIGRLLINTLTENTELPEFQCPDENLEYRRIFEYGENIKIHQDLDKIRVPDEIAIPYKVSICDERLNIKLEASDYLIPGANNRPELSYGLLMHDILSSITTIDDVDDSVNTAFRKGLLSMEERNTLREKLGRSFESDLVKIWFNKDARVWIEQDILLPQGLSRRPDRVVQHKGITYVIDFKFGMHRASHKHQVKEYMDLIRDILSSKVEGYLWYVDGGVIEKVNLDFKSK